MNKSVLVLGAYGNFGSRIAQGLIRRGITVILGGRDLDKLNAAVIHYNSPLVTMAKIDASGDISHVLIRLKPYVVINTIGPFQGANYAIATSCIESGIHYIDLADGRDYVAGFGALDAKAKAKNLTLITGASTVPCLSSAVIEALLPMFSSLESVDFGIAPGQGAQRGLATTRAILSYVGKPLKPHAGHEKSFGWQGLRRVKFPELGQRWMADCDIPDLDILPQSYGLTSVRFGAGLELGIMHMGLWLMSWLVRFRLIKSLEPMAATLLKIADLFDAFGSKDGGLYMRLSGLDHSRKALTKDWFIVAKNADGPQIPCVPAILLAQTLINNDKGLKSGAYDAHGLITLEAYIEALKEFEISVYAPI